MQSDFFYAKAIGLFKSIVITVLLFSQCIGFSAYADWLNGPKQASLQEITKDYPDLKNMVQAIFERYPPSEYVYVGMGKSPTAVTAMIKVILGNDSAINIPLSEMDGFSPGGHSRHDFGDKSEYSAKRVNRLRQHFAAFLPESKLGNKKVLLMDFAESGASLENTQRELRSYFESLNSNAPRKVQSLGFPQDDAAKRQLEKLGIDILDPPKGVLKKMIGHAYGAYEEYHKFYNSGRWESEAYNPPARRSLEEIMRSSYKESQNFWDASSPYYQESWAIQRRKIYLEGMRINFDEMVAIYTDKAQLDSTLIQYISEKHFASPLLQSSRATQSSPASESSRVSSLSSLIDKIKSTFRREKPTDVHVTTLEMLECLMDKFKSGGNE